MSNHAVLARNPLHVGVIRGKWLVVLVGQSRGLHYRARPGRMQALVQAAEMPARLTSSVQLRLNL